MSPTPTYVPPPEPQRSGLMTALVAGAIIALVAANIYLYVQIDHVRTDMATMQDRLKTELSNLKDASSVTMAAEQRHLEAMKEELEAARNQARNLVQRGEGRGAGPRRPAGQGHPGRRAQDAAAGQLANQ